MTVLISWIIFALYILSCSFYWQGFSRNRTTNYHWAQRVLVLTLVCHLGLICFLTFQYGRIPIANLSEALSTFVWLTSCIYIVLEWRLKNYSMGAFILTILSILMAIGIITFQNNEAIPEVLKDVKFEAHVLALLISYGSFSISFIASLLHTLLDREIQKRRFRLFYSRLPSLPFFQRISNFAIDIGLAFATIGIGLGILQAMTIWENFFLTDPKFLTAALTWLIYCFHFLGRRFAGWGAQRSATISLIGFSLLLFSFLIISLFFTSLHNFTG